MYAVTDALLRAGCGLRDTPGSGVQPARPQHVPSSRAREGTWMMVEGGMGTSDLSGSPSSRGELGPRIEKEAAEWRRIEIQAGPRRRLALADGTNGFAPPSSFRNADPFRTEGLSAKGTLPAGSSWARTSAMKRDGTTFKLNLFAVRHCRSSLAPRGSRTVRPHASTSCRTRGRRARRARATPTPGRSRADFRVSEYRVVHSLGGRSEPC